MISNSLIKQNAKSRLSGKWGKVIVAIIVGSILSGVIAMLFEAREGDTGLFAIFMSLVISAPVTLGYAYMFLDLVNEKEPFSQWVIWNGFEITKWFKILLMTILLTLIVTIGFLFFIIPGIVAICMFSQVTYLFAEDSTKPIISYFKESAELIKGYKIQYICLQLWFLLLTILSALTLFIGLIWVIPYKEACNTQFYMSLKQSKDKINML